MTAVKQIVLFPARVCFTKPSPLLGQASATRCHATSSLSTAQGSPPQVEHTEVVTHILS